MKLLLIGGTGQLGGDILRNAGPEFDILAPGREELDLANFDDIHRKIGSFVPDVVINATGFHNVPLCETEFEEAFRINCLAVRELARACRKSGARLCTFTTDYVFGGDKGAPYTESDRPEPLQIYGITKLSGEYAALSALPQGAFIVRTCGLYGLTGARSKGGNFVDNRIVDAKNSRIVEIACDQVVSPTYTDDLSKAVMQLIGREGIDPGIYHLANEGECSWYEFTRAIYGIMGIDVEVRAVDRKGVTGEMRRPLYSALANTKARSLGVTLPHWRDALQRYLRIKYLHAENTNR